MEWILFVIIAVWQHCSQLSSTVPMLRVHPNGFHQLKLFEQQVSLPNTVIRARSDS